MDESRFANGEFCPYCGVQSQLVDSSIIYRKSYGPIYLCKNHPKCDAFVGCHPGTIKALGRLANKELRVWKQMAHVAFDSLWKDGTMSRGYAYSLLSQWLEIESERCHIGMFDVKTCQQVVMICTMAIAGGKNPKDYLEELLSDIEKGLRIRNDSYRQDQEY